MTATTSRSQLRRREVSLNLCLDAGYDTRRCASSCSTGREIERLIGQAARRGSRSLPRGCASAGPSPRFELALAGGKAAVDRRRDIRDCEQRRDIERALSERGG